jgi:aquaporin Z
MSMGKKALAEFIGTFWLVLGGCGTAVLAGDHVGWLGVSLAFGLTVVTMAYAIGHISGCHLNPAVSFGLVAGGRMPARDLPTYVIAQVLGGVAAALVLMLVLQGGNLWETVKQAGFAANGYGEHSPGHYALVAGLVAEVVFTAIFLIVIMGITDNRAPKGFAPLAIGLCLTLIHLVLIPVTNTSVNPARSTGPALFVGGWALSQLWLFWVAPIAGGIIGALIYHFAAGESPAVTGPEIEGLRFEGETES